jgi:hypothetical protein
VHCAVRFTGGNGITAAACSRIPYAKRIPPNARLRTYPLVERNGAIWFWYDLAGGEPAFDVPAIPEWGDAEFGTEWDHHVWTIRAHPQDILENGIDWPHVMPVHGFDSPRGVVASFDGPLYRWGADTGKEIELLDGRREDFSFRVDTWGLGLSQVRYQGLFSVVFQIGQTPGRRNAHTPVVLDSDAGTRSQRTRGRRCATPLHRRQRAHARAGLPDLGKQVLSRAAAAVRGGWPDPEIQALGRPVLSGASRARSLRDADKGYLAAGARFCWLVCRAAAQAG